MKRSFLESRGAIALLVVTLSGVALASACGGKVVVDAGTSGSNVGGATSTGPTMSSTMSQTVGPTGTMSSVISETATGTTGTSMMCGCDEFCAKVKQCGGPGSECFGFCDQVPQDVKQCVCA